MLKLSVEFFFQFCGKVVNLRSELVVELSLEGSYFGVQEGSKVY